MNDESALLPVEERTVIFYDDALTAVLVQIGGEEQVFVPVRPLCDYLGVDWSAQYRRLSRDPVLSEAQATVAVYELRITHTSPLTTDHRPLTTDH